MFFYLLGAAAQLGSVRAPARARGRIIRTSSIRGRSSSSAAAAAGSVIMSSTRPAPYVPEDLVAQAQSVLQGRSRNLIIRELQRTNLDVNLAVNNLLSRDEEDGDDGDDGQDNYVPEDLISLLDAGINADHPSVIIDADAMFSDDAMFGYSQARSSRSTSSTRRSADRERDAVAAAAAAAAAAATSSGVSPSSAAASMPERERVSQSQIDRESIFRWRERQYFGPKRWLESALRDSSAWSEGKDDSDTKKRESLNRQCPLWLGDDLEFWPEKPGGKEPVRFAKIAVLHSELVAVSERGHLYQWRWCDMTPFRGDNPSGKY